MNKLQTILLTIITLTVISCKQKVASTKIELKTSEVEIPEVDENSFMMKMQSKALKDSFKGIYTSNGKEND
jgi:hypothetical protein